MAKFLEKFKIEAKDGDNFKSHIDKIMNLHFFRKLSGKTQVILSLTGPAVRTRLTHTVEVARIARELSEELGLNDNLSEAIALAHDIGHTPFGHVGERTLKEIMCGCDTLKGRIPEIDFVNSGFKHNLQSFRVLTELERIADNNDSDWAYILWGVPVHSKMSYSKPYSGMENEIYISCKHCDWVFSCFFHEKKECKRNILDKKKRDESSYFFEEEFAVQTKSVSELCQAIREKKYELGTIKAADNTIDWLNELIQIPELCEKTLDKKKNLKLSNDIKKLKEQTEKNRKKGLADLKHEEQKEIIKLNRLAIELLHSQETPKSQTSVCKPWYCATLTLKTKEDIKESNLKLGQTTDEYLAEKYIKDELVQDIYCSKKCYLSELYQYKIDHKEYIKYFPYLFDHPFPNSFYVKALYDSFIKKDIADFVSIEAQVVMQADEIAQRQQDLEDAISKNLIPFEKARDDVKKLVEKVLPNKNGFLLEIKNSNNQKVLGELIVRIYKELICDATISNFEVFTKREDKEQISIYCLMNIIYWFSKNDNLRKKWILSELSKLQSNKNTKGEGSDIDGFFDINYEGSYLYFVAWEFLDEKSKIAEFADYNDLLSEVTSLLKIKYDYEHDSSGEIQPFKRYIIEIDKMGEFLKDTFKDTFKDFIHDKTSDKKYWRNIRRLNLHSFHILNTIFTKHITNGNILVSDELRNMNSKKLIENVKYDEKQAFAQWRRALRTDSNSVLAKLVNFVSDNDNKRKYKEDALKDFHEMQKNYILKSEMVEKNDGKANYILKRLFNAYMTNSHQLPDSGLISILLSLTDQEIIKKMQDDEIETFNKYFSKLKKTMITTELFYNKSKDIGAINFLEIPNDDIFIELKKDTSNEVMAILDGKKKLYYSLRMFNDKALKFRDLSRSEKKKDIDELKEVLLEFRGILDNPILNAMSYWKSLLSRGVCDYIAGLTDQEAIDEYEKLYAGIMELV